MVFNAWHYYNLRRNIIWYIYFPEHLLITIQYNILKVLSSGADRSEQTLQTQIRLLLKLIWVYRHLWMHFYSKIVLLKFKNKNTALIWSVTIFFIFTVYFIFCDNRMLKSEITDLKKEASQHRMDQADLKRDIHR